MTPDSRKSGSEVDDMIDEDPDWISVYDAIAYVEATQQCHRGIAVDLVRQAVNNLKLKSRTANSPSWIEWHVSGEQRFVLDRIIEVSRKGLLELFPERQDATRSTPPEIGSAQRQLQPISDGIASAIKELWPEGIPKLLRAKDRNDKIHESLISRGIISKSEDVSRTIQKTP